MRLLGIALTDIVRGEEAQLSLFADERRERTRKREQAIDAIRQKFGADTIVRGSSLEVPVSVGRRYRAKAEQERQQAEKSELLD